MLLAQSLLLLYSESDSVFGGSWVESRTNTGCPNEDYRKPLPGFRQGGVKQTKHAAHMYKIRLTLVSNLIFNLYYFDFKCQYCQVLFVSISGVLHLLITYTQFGTSRNDSTTADLHC